MTYFAGIDVSLEESSICVVDAGGKIPTCSPTSCAVSTGSDRGPCQHDERAAARAYRRRDRCVWNAARTAIPRAATANWLPIS